MRIIPNCSFALATALLAAAFLPGTVAAAGAPDAVDTCASCHGKDGVSDEGSLPTIAGASSFFLENQLMIFAEGARPCSEDEFAETDDVSAGDHCALAGELSEDQIISIAEHYASQDFVAADQSVDQGLADQGQSIHDDSCSNCHTEGGGAAIDDAGILAGQWKPYLVEQMEYFRDGERWQPESMQKVMKDLSDEDIKALAEYYASEGG